MDIRPINDEYAVTAQIALADLDRIKEMGFKSVVCHRPDDEDPGQPDFAEIEAKATSLGLEMRHIPVSGPPTPITYAGERSAQVIEEDEIIARWPIKVTDEDVTIMEIDRVLE